MPRAKDKERILKAAREKQLVTYKGVPVQLLADFSTETMQAKTGMAQWIECQTAGLIPVKGMYLGSGHIPSGGCARGS